MLPVPEDPEPTAVVIEQGEEVIPQQQLPLDHEYILRRSERIAAAQTSDKELIVLFSEADETRAALRRHLQFRSNWVDKEFAFHISVRAAMKERPTEARPVILSELQQMLDKGVWHGVRLSHLTHAERKAIIRSSMFLKDKYSHQGCSKSLRQDLWQVGINKTKAFTKICPHQLLQPHRS